MVVTMVTNITWHAATNHKQTWYITMVTEHHVIWYDQSQAIPHNGNHGDKINWQAATNHRADNMAVTMVTDITWDALTNHRSPPSIAYRTSHPRHLQRENGTNIVIHTKCVSACYWYSFTIYKRHVNIETKSLHLCAQPNNLTHKIFGNCVRWTYVGLAGQRALGNWPHSNKAPLVANLHRSVITPKRWRPMCRSVNIAHKMASK